MLYNEEKTSLICCLGGKTGTIVIPESVTEIWGDAFNGCSSLTDIHAAKENESYASEDGVLYSKEKTSLLRCPEGKTGTIVIPNGVTSIGRYAFSGCSGLTEIILPDGVTSIGDYAFLNCNNLAHVMLPASLENIGWGCFSDCPNITLWVDSGSYGEIYAKENDIPCEYYSGNNRIARLRVTEEGGEPVTSGYLVKWYADNRLIGSGNMISVMETVETLAYKVELKENALFSYYPPEEQTVDLSGEDLNFTCELRKIPSVTLTGKVTDAEGEALSGALVTLTQMADSSHVRTKETRTDDAGAYSVEILDLPTSAEIQADGYFRRTVTAIADLAGADVDLGTEILTKLPENKITLSLTMAKAALSGEQRPAVSLSNGNGLEFSVYNETKQKEVSEFTVQYPYLMLGEREADGNDVITISVVDTKKTMTAAPVYVALNQQKMGKAEILFVQNGSFEASLRGELPAVVMIFDRYGNLVRKKAVTSATFSSGELSDGTYQAAFMQKTNLLESTPHLSKLSEYGLAAGKDYVLKTAAVENGTVTGLGGVTVPKFDESLLYCTDSQGTSVTANKQSVPVGNYVMLRAEYKLKEKYAASGEKRIMIEIPDGMQFVENSVSVDGKAANYTYGNNVLTVSSDKNSGIARCFVIPEEDGEKDVSAELAFAWEGEEKRQPLGAAHIIGERMKLVVPERTGQKTVTVTGKAMAGSGITVYDNGTQAGKTRSNAAGNWSLTFDLARPFYYSYHDIYATVENERYENILYSDTHTVVYEQGYLDVSKVTMYNMGDNGENRTVFDFLNPGKQGSYRIFPGRYKDFTFVIEFAGDASQAENVVLNVFSKSGQVRTFDADYDEAKNVWVVNTQFTSYNDAPVNVGVEYSRKEAENTDYSALSHPDAAECNREYLAAVDGALEDIVDVEIKEDTDEKLVLGFSPAGGEGEAWNMEMRELDYAAFRIEELKSQGFVKCEADDPLEEPQYLKMAIEESGIVFSIVDEKEKNAFSFTIPLGFLLPVEGEAQGVSVLSYERSGGMSDMPDLPKWGEDMDAMLTVLDIAAGELLPAMEYNSMRQMLAEKNIHSMNRASDIQKLMAVECEDGSLSLPKEIWTEAQKRYGAVQAADTATYSWLESDLALYQRKIWNSLAFTVATLGFGKVIKIGGGIGKTVRVKKNSKNAKYTKYVIRSKTVRENLDNRLKKAWDGIRNADLIGGELDGPVGDFFRAIDTSSFQYWDDIKQGYAELDKLYDGLESYIRSNMRCKINEDPKSNEKKGPDEDKEPILDPSSYVCEAVPSNRLEGVTASLYGYRDKTDSFGEPTGEQEEYLWNAKDYDQANPLLTDANGAYMWDVPEGQWRVKYEKEGYEKAYSDWLPVPPPQTEVHAALVSTDAPQVKTVNAYKDKVKITFTQYMDIASVNTDNVKISVGGQAVSGVITACNAEESFADSTVSYARTFLFVPDQELEGEADVTIRAAANYAGTRMTEPFDCKTKVKEEPKSIEADEYIEIAHNSKEKVEIQVMPKEAAEGLKVTVKSSSPGILSAEEDSIELDADGKAEFTLSGHLPGGGEILLAVDGTDLEKNIIARVGAVSSPEGQKNKCGKVNASIASGSVVSKGAKVELSVETEGAEIYYTLDGSCPCAADSPSRLKYAAPIEITKETFLIAYAVKDGYEDGATTGFLYYVHEDGKEGDGKPNDDKKDNGLQTNLSEQSRLKRGAVFTGQDGVLQYKVLKESNGKNAGTVSVTGAKKKKSKIAIPANVTDPKTGEKFRVVSVAAKAFKGNKKVTQVTVGDQVETIGKNAFYGCKKLSRVTLGKKVSKIEDKAF